MRKRSVSTTSLYLAGVWISHIHRELFWCPIRPGRCDNGIPSWPPGTEDSLPSCSWSTSKVPVTFNYSLTRLHEIFDARARTWRDQEVDYKDAHRLIPQGVVEYLSTDISPKGSDPFGGIRGGILRIRGHFFDEDVSEAKLFQEDYQRYRILLGRQKQYALNVAFDYGPFILKGLSLRFLFLLQSSYRSWNYGIVLHANEIGHFRRIGIFGTYYGGERYADLDWNLKLGELTLASIYLINRS